MTIYLAGGGSAADDQPLWQTMLPGVHRILYWPLALPGERHAAAHDWLVDSLRHFGFTAEVESWTTLRNHAATELAEFDLLFVGGGNTFNLLHQVRENEFVEPVRRFVADGGVYYGGSAGAVLACNDIAIAEGHNPNEPGLTDLRALGLVPGVSILPHYSPDQEMTARKWTADKGIRLIGLPETAGLIASGESLRLVGDTAYSFVAGGMRAYDVGSDLNR